MTAGFPSQTLSPYGLEPTSRAFFRAPGIDLLYSGVAKMIPSQSFTSLRNFVQVSGVFDSVSSLYRGRFEIMDAELNYNA